MSLSVTHFQIKGLPDAYRFALLERSLAGLQQQLADKAIVSHNALARLEKGSVDSRLSTLQAHREGAC